MDRAAMEKLVEFGANLKNLSDKVDHMDIKLDELRTGKATETATELGITKTKVDRLERIVYGVGTLAVAEGITLLVQLLK